jgi:hypothetical protein
MLLYSQLRTAVVVAVAAVAAVAAVVAQQQ